MIIYIIQYAREANFEQELAFWDHMYNADYHIDQFLFIDESHVDDKSVNRNFGYALSGQRAVFQQLFARGNRYTVSAALDFEGIVDYTIFAGIASPKFLFTDLSLTYDSSINTRILYQSFIIRLVLKILGSIYI